MLLICNEKKLPFYDICSFQWLYVFSLEWILRAFLMNYRHANLADLIFGFTVCHKNLGEKCEVFPFKIWINTAAAWLTIQGWDSSAFWRNSDFPTLKICPFVFNSELKIDFWSMRVLFTSCYEQYSGLFNFFSESHSCTIDLMHMTSLELSTLAERSKMKLLSAPS